LANRLTRTPPPRPSVHLKPVGQFWSARITNAVRTLAVSGFVALCPELDIASEGGSIEEARTNLIEALTVFFESASESEIARRVPNEVFVTQVEVPVG
jgi:predicted RNase H-like HicB family nuclease